MKIGKWNGCFCVSVIIVLCNAAVSHATATLSLSPSGNGQYVVQGTDFNGVSALEFVLKYDPTALKNPKIEQGGLTPGALMVTNTDVPGIVRFASVEGYPKANSGTGTIAIVTFDATGKSSAPPTVNNPRILDVSGSPMSLTVSTLDASGNVVTTITNDSWSTPTGGWTTTTTPGTAAAGGSVSAPTAWLGGVNMPSEGTPVEARAKEGTPVAVAEIEKTEGKMIEAAVKEKVSPAAEVSQPAPTADSRNVRDTSVLEQFRLFQGERTPGNLIGLITRSVAGSGQKPLVALSDGKTAVQLSVECPSAGKSAPNFALKGAKLVSLKKSGASTWLVEILPDKGTFDVTVNVLQDNAVRQIALTVVPPLPADLKIVNGGTMTEADFSQFLKDRGTAKAPRFDLNGDGKRDYVDDYIFAANYVVRADAAKPAEKEKKP